MAADRSAGRNVHIYDARDPDVVLGGLILTNGVTNANFYSMVEIFLWFNEDYFLRHGDDTEVQRDEQAFRPGDYYIVTNGMYFHCIVQLVLSSNRPHYCQQRALAGSYDFSGQWYPSCSVP